MRLRLLGCILVAATMVLPACAPRHEFAIYLTMSNLKVADVMAQDGFPQITEKPIIAMGDIIEYRLPLHEMVLKDAAVKRIDKMKVPTSGVPFVACVDGKPVYKGAFWTPLSSQSFDGITIWTLPPDPDNIYKIRPGYPGSSFYQGTDPRANPAILDALREAKKLK